MFRLQMTVVALMASAGAAHATMLTEVPDTDLSSPVLTPNITSFEVTGSDMADRMRVTATFLSPTGAPIVEQRTWQLSGVPEGGEAIGSFWSVTQAGDTASNPWQLDVNPIPGGFGAPPIVSLLLEFDNSIDGQGVVFDRFVGEERTPGTSTGLDFLVLDNSPALDFSVADPLYRNPADNPNDGPGFFEDVFATLEVTFEQVPFLMDGGYFIRFEQDADTAVPAPGAAGLAFVAGLAGLRRKRRA